MNRTSIGVIMGGASSEREVSLRSGRAVAQALEAAGHEVVRLVWDGREDLFPMLKNTRLDKAFIALHGRHGEDGCVQGMLELLNIPYSGSNVLSSALAMDKLKAKELFRLYNIPTPPYYAVRESEQTELHERHGSFGFPVVVKPRREGSSVGVAIARDFSKLQSAVSDALRYDECVLVERFIAAKEIAVGILNGRVLGAIEVAPKDGLYDYNAKYVSGTTEYFIPARIPESRMLGVLNLAERAAASLDCSGAVRVDLLVTEGENEYVLEVNTLPGMTETSLLPKIAQAAGYSFTDLCEAIAAGARLHNAPRQSLPARPADPARLPTSEPIRIAV
ncbi:MAG: hypothetical protein RJA70_2593 [Pseudomonadota bacterium]|jgi:D-alanine-D-alanine ligase